MKKLTMTAAATAALFCSGLTFANQAAAQDYNYGSAEPGQYAHTPLGSDRRERRALGQSVLGRDLGRRQLVFRLLEAVRPAGGGGAEKRQALIASDLWHRPGESSH